MIRASVGWVENEHGGHDDQGFEDRSGAMFSDGEQAYRQALLYLSSMKGKEATAEEMSGVIRQLTGALDSQNYERLSRLLYIAATRVRSWPATAEPYLSAWAAAKVAVTGSTLEVVDEHRELTTDDVSKLSQHVSRFGLAGLSPRQVLLLVLICLFTIGLPFAQDTLPQNVQNRITSEEVALGIGVPVALALMEKRQK